MSKALREKDSLLGFRGINRPQMLPLYHGFTALLDPGQDAAILIPQVSQAYATFLLYQGSDSDCPSRVGK